MSNTVPDGWGVHELGDLARKIEGGGTPSRTEASYWNGDIPWATVKDLRAISLGSTEEQITERGLENSASKLTPAHTMIIASRMAVGKAVYFDRDVAINQDLKAFYPVSQVDWQFLLHWYLSKSETIEGLATGSTVKGIRLDDLKLLPIDLPPLPEQQKIAAILSSVDNLIEKTRAQIDKLKDLKAGMTQELLTKGIGHTKFKCSPIGRIPESWTVTTLGETATLQRGHDLTQANTVRGQYPVISSSGVSGMHDQYTTQGPGVLVGRKGSIGRVHYIESDFWAHDTSLYVTNFHENDVLYVYQLFSWMNLQKYGTKSGSPSLNRNDLHPLKVAMPPLAEQKEIRKVLMRVDERTSALRGKLGHLTSLKKALMQGLLTGKVRVKVDQKESAVA